MVSEEQIQKWADEAEVGYDVEELKRRGRGVPVPREPFSFGGWNDSRFGIGDITGNDGINFWTKTKKITKKWSERSSNWMS